MEQIVIQSDNTALSRLDEFIGRICMEQHIWGQFGIVSMAVTNAVEHIMAHCQDAGRTQISVECGGCQGGIYFSISSPVPCFNPMLKGKFPEGDGVGEEILRMHMVSDLVQYNEEGSAVRMEFCTEGIERDWTMERRQILDNYYAHKKVLAE